MIVLPLHFRNGHLFLEVGGSLWLFDTGAPTSFGKSNTLTLINKTFKMGSSYLDLTAEKLSSFVGVDCVGLLGADVLGQFDFLLDVPDGRVEISMAELEHAGAPIRLNDFMGIPIVSGRIRGVDYQMFFDTGAQISYFQNEEILSSFPSAGSLTDFYPGVEPFKINTHNIDVMLGTLNVTLRCGVLPGLLGATLMMAGAEGIIGNESIITRTVGYFPRRHLLVL